MATPNTLTQKDQIEIKQFESTTSMDFQRKFTVLPGTVDVVNNVVGSSVSFPIYATAAPTSHRNQYQNYAVNIPVVRREEVELFDSSSQIILTKEEVPISNVNQRAALEKCQMAERAREMDDIILDAFKAVTDAKSANKAAITTTASLKTPNILKALDVLKNNFAVNNEPVFCALPPEQLSSLTQDDAFRNSRIISNYTEMPINRTKENYGATNLNNLPRWHGIYFIELAGNQLDTVTVSSVEYDQCFMWTQSTTKYCTNEDNATVNVGYDDRQRTWYINLSMFHGAKVIKPEGLVKINAKKVA